MTSEAKRIYWRLREAMPLIWRSLVEDPPFRRLIRFAKSHLRKKIIIDGIVIRLSPGMGSAAVAYMLNGKYEKPERSIVMYALEPEDRVLELGTGIGYLSALCAKRIGSDRVTTFEANSQLRPVIEETYKLNNVSPNVEFCMLGKSSGETSFFVSKEFWSSSTDPRRTHSKRISVPVKSFNETLSTIKPTFLLIDIEGGESELVEFMRLDGVKKVCIELHPWVIGAEAEQRMRRFFIGHGFREDISVSDEEHVLYRRDQATHDLA